MGTVNRSWRVARSTGDITDEDLAWDEAPAREPADGEVLVDVQWLSLDATDRAWIRDRGGSLPPLGPGDVMRAAGLGVVRASRHPRFAAGEVVSGMLGWQTEAVVPGDGLARQDPARSVEDTLGALNHLGATAWLGLREVARPRAGETVVVTGAAGAVGSLAAQIATREGARVVAVASTAPRCRWLTDELGLDVVIDRLAEDVAPALARACPEGVDVVLDTVGGPVLDAALARLNLGARVALASSSAAPERPAPGPAHFGMLLARRARLTGYSFLDFPFRFADALVELEAWVRGGQLRYHLDVVDGLAHAPAALRRVLAGETHGALVVKVS